MTPLNMLSVVGCVLTCSRAVSILWASEKALSIGLMSVTVLALVYLWEERS